jgi:hypothetical protein
MAFLHTWLFAFEQHASKNLTGGNKLKMYNPGGHANLQLIFVGKK